MNDGDWELQHLTAESTSKKNAAAQTDRESRQHDKEFKKGKKRPPPRRKTEIRQEEGEGHCHPALSTSYALTDGKHHQSCFCANPLK